jgi:hypothetical protein
MEAIDVDEITEVTYFDDSVEVRFKNGTTTSFSGPELPEIFAQLNHWTPPTA